MKYNSLKKRLEEMLSEGQGKQLLWLLVIIIIAILVCWGIIVLVFHDGSMKWQDLLALFLDPGSFGGAGTHDLFRIVVALLGMFLFSALLISLVTNMFENMADSFKNGVSRYVHKDHILILGGGHMLNSMVFALTHKDSPYKEEDIVVVTTCPTKKLRSSVFSLPFLDSDKEKSLQKRMTFYSGDRDNETSLMKKGIAKNAKVIYIIGEDNEINHDSVSIRCCRKLKEICRNTGRDAIHCYLILNDQASFDVFKYSKDSETLEGSDLKVDVINSNEYIAEQILVAKHGFSGKSNYPCIDYREIIPDGGSFEFVEGIRACDDKYVRFVIAGMSDIGRAMAITAAHNCHFPNFDNGKRRTVITFLNKDIRANMDAFVASFSNLFKLSHHRYIRFDEFGQPHDSVFTPDERFGDFLDIEWEFIDADFNTPGMRRLLDQWVEDEKNSVSFALCMENQNDNTAAALHMPDTVYKNGCPIFVYQQDYGDVLFMAQKLKRFANIYPFGMVSSVQGDPLFLLRSQKGQRVNFIYNQEYDDHKYPDEHSAWYTIPEAHKLSSIYCANSMLFKERSFDVDKRQGKSIYEVEHRRWMVSALILGYSAVDKETRSNWKTRRLAEADNGPADKEFKELKRSFIHMDITPYDALIPSEMFKDKVIIDRMNYILRGE